MRCKSCGQEIDDGMAYCQYCGKCQTEPPPPCAPGAEEVNCEEVKTYLVWAILSTLFCCLPFGILAIIYSSKVTNCLALRKFPEARQASKTAKNWVIASVVASVVGNLLIIGYYALVFCLSAGLD